MGLLALNSVSKLVYLGSAIACSGFQTKVFEVKLRSHCASTRVDARSENAALSSDCDAHSSGNNVANRL